MAARFVRSQLRLPGARAARRGQLRCASAALRAAVRTHPGSRLDEVSGLAASHAHADTVGAERQRQRAALVAIGTRGGVAGHVPCRRRRNIDWEDLDAFDLEHALPAGRRHRRQRRHPQDTAAARGRGTGAAARRRCLRPAWSIAFRWPDGARDCEAVAVDAAPRPGAADLEEARPAGTVPRAAATVRSRPAGRPTHRSPVRHPPARARALRDDPAYGTAARSGHGADLRPTAACWPCSTTARVLFYERRRIGQLGRPPSATSRASTRCPGCRRPKRSPVCPTAAACARAASTARRPCLYRQPLTA